MVWELASCRSATALDKETVVFPCFLGGAEWGGPAVDPKRGIIFINSNEWACVVALTENKPARSTGERTYHNLCSVCHNDDRKGSPPTYPSLVDVGTRLTQTQIEATILQGKGRMPAFPNLQGSYLQSLVQFVRNGGESGPKGTDENAVKAENDATHVPGGSREAATARAGADVYGSKCATCHGDHREGKPPMFPALTGGEVAYRLNKSRTGFTRAKTLCLGFPDLTARS